MQPTPPTILDAQIISDITANGYCIIDHFLPDAIVTALAEEISQLKASCALQHAGIGREQLAVNKEIRGDSTYWLNVQEATEAQQYYFKHMERLRLSINQHLFLGLFGLECHLAYYPPGTFYRKHLDCFAAHNSEKPQRKLSCIVYLNHHWHSKDGGQLRLYLDTANPEFTNETTPQHNFIDVMPSAGKAVFFLSDAFYHEVMPATRARLSLTGWFFSRPSPANI